MNCLVRLCVIFFIGVLYEVCFALPKGNRLKGTPVVKKADGNGEFHIDCDRVFLNRGQPSVLLSRDQKSFYFATKIRARKFDLNKSYLMRFDFKTKQLFRKATIDQGLNVAFVPIRYDFEDMLFMSFTNHDLCFAGPAMGTGIRIDGKLATKTEFKKSKYFLMQTNELPSLADLESGYVVSLGNRTFQARREVAFKDHEWPLQFDKKDDLLDVVRMEQGKNLMVRTNVKSNKKIAELVLDDGQLIVQDGPYYLFVRKLYKSNDLIIREHRGFSVGDGRYRMSLPRQYQIDDAMMVFDSKKNMALVFGKEPLRSVRWSDGYVFDYKNNIIVGSFKLDRGHYIDSAVSLRDGKGAIFVLKAYKDQSLVGMRIFHYDTRKWEPIHLEIY